MATEDKLKEIKAALSTPTPHTVIRELDEAGTRLSLTTEYAHDYELDAEEPSWIVMVGLAPEEQYIVATDGYLYEPIPASEWARLLYRDLWRRPSHF